MSSFPDLNTKLEIDDKPEHQEVEEKPSTSSVMSGDRPKRAGRKPGRRSSKMDVRAKLERSRQSARECRARKKMRYQYLEDLVANREKAVFALRNELEMYKQWCLQVDKGLVPLMLLKICEEEIKKENIHEDGGSLISKHQVIGNTEKIIRQAGTSLALNGEQVNELDLTTCNGTAEKERKEISSGAMGGPSDVLATSSLNLDDVLSVLTSRQNVNLACENDEKQSKGDNSKIPSLFQFIAKGDNSCYINEDTSSIMPNRVSIRTDLPTIEEGPE